MIEALAKLVRCESLTEDEAERVAKSYGTNYPRLQILKQRFDPDNLFRMNLNITPAGHR